MIKLAIPEIGDEELDEIRKVFDSKYLVQGEFVEDFENLVKNYLNVKHVIAVSSGTAALHLVLTSLGIKPGDEVIVPDFTFTATANAVELTGAKPCFADIDIGSLCIDPEKIEPLITEKTKLIMPVHEFGQCADLDKILNIADKYKIQVVEDAACVLGAEYKGIKAGTIGTAGCFSLHPRKVVTTGEGGLIATNNDNIADTARILRNHGIKYINGKQRFVAAGFNYRMTNIQGAIGKVQLCKIEKFYENRIRIVKTYNELLKDIKNVIIPEEKVYGKHCWQAYHILLGKGISRDKVIQEMKIRNIETSFGAFAVHQEPYYSSKYNLKDSEYQNAVYAADYGLMLPMHSMMDYEDQKYIAGQLNEVLNG